MMHQYRGKLTQENAYLEPLPAVLKHILSSPPGREDLPKKVVEFHRHILCAYDCHSAARSIIALTDTQFPTSPIPGEFIRTMQDTSEREKYITTALHDWEQVKRLEAFTKNFLSQSVCVPQLSELPHHLASPISRYAAMVGQASRTDCTIVLHHSFYILESLDNGKDALVLEMPGIGADLQVACLSQVFEKWTNPEIFNAHLRLSKSPASLLVPVRA